MVVVVVVVVAVVVLIVVVVVVMEVVAVVVLVSLEPLTLDFDHFGGHLVVDNHFPLGDFH